MPEKSANFAGKYSWMFRQNPMIQRWFKVLTLAVFLGVLVIWKIDDWNVSSFHKDFIPIKLNNSTHSEENLSPYIVSLQFNSTFHNIPRQNLTQNQLNFTDANQNLTQNQFEFTNANRNLTQNQFNFTGANQNLTQNQFEFTDANRKSTQNQFDITNASPNLAHGDQNLTNSQTPATFEWISVELGENYSSKLLTGWLAPGGERCSDSKAVDIRIQSLDGIAEIELKTGEIHEFVFQALDELGNPNCRGGDYFETDLSGDSWKSRPPIIDLGNGTYKFALQVHPDFPGKYNLTVILLFRRYEGLKFSPERFAFDKVVRTIPIKFVKSSIQLPEIAQCQKSDFDRNVWSGRWTRHTKNDKCVISDDGRYRCIKPSFQCPYPWCNGSLGLLESNGWTYSTHCSFKLFSRENAWECLNNRWIFFWGDSNHCDTIRNMFHFILDLPEIKVVPRLFDMNITNPRNISQMIRITSIFNGNSNSTGNYQGLNSLRNEGYRQVLRDYFSQDIVPDTVIMNSGLHDGVFWANVRRFMKGAEEAAKFWAEVVEGVRRRGVVPPEIIYRSTVATGGYARRLAFNPHKMEAFNGVFLDKLRQFGVVNRVIDHFDMTYPWHYDNRCNDGVHYGRAPAKMRWRDGGIGHQYFVDLMLGHVLLNALCAR
ncbi:hypothetical protein LguiA_001662 [Lonicera macranthoides]